MRRLTIGIALLTFACGSSKSGGDDTDPTGGSGGSSSGTGGSGGITTGGTTATGGTGGSSSSGGSNAAAGTTSSGGSAGSAGSSGDAGSSSGGTGPYTGPYTADGCPAAQEAGTWENVTPDTMKMTGDFTDGPRTIAVDPAKPNEIYAFADHDGAWKSTDCGVNFSKISTGTNGEQLDTGGPWGLVIDPNPNRDQETDPALYVNQGYGANALWKSTDGGVGWANVWDDNVYAEDGTTSISGDVGNDLAGVQLLSSENADHLLEFLHSYWGSGDNNGIFESTDGGGSWVLHKTPGFNFQPHSDLLSGVDANTWWVAHGYPGEFWRTTDAGDTWTQSTGDAAGGMGHSIARAGDTFYTGSDYHSGVFRSTDVGGSWKLVSIGNQVGWVGVTATNVYACNGYGDVQSQIISAPLDDDETWSEEQPAGMNHCGSNNPAVIFDGDRYVILAAQETGGLWRFVEPNE